MAMSIPVLAAAIVTGIGQSGPPTTPVTGFATGIINEIEQNGMATFGSVPTPNPVSGVTGPGMASKIQAAAGYPNVSTPLSNFCSAVATYINSNAIVTYTGPIPPANPAWFLGGTISGLSGSALASAVQSSMGFPSVSSQLLGMCTAITDHITNFASVTSGVIS